MRFPLSSLLSGAAVCLLWLAATPAQAVNTTMLNLVMPDARFVAGFDVERVKNTPAGRYLLDSAGIHDAEFKKLEGLTGFDPRRDLQEVVVAAIEGKPHGEALVIGRGFFDEARLTGLALGQEGAVSSYKGVKLLSARSKKDREEAVAFLGGNLILAGPRPNVEAAIDRHQSGAKAPAALVELVMGASTSYDAWAVSIGSPAALAPRAGDPTVGAAMKGDLFQAVEQASGGLRFETDVEVGGEAVTRSDRDALALADVMRFLSTMVISNKPASDPLVRAAESLQVTTSANRTRFTMRIPQADLQQILPFGGKKVRTRPVSTTTH